MSNSEKEEVIAGLQKIYDETAYNVTPYKAISLIERQSARIAELERENAELRSLLPDSGRAKKITERAAIRAENKKLHAQLVAAKKAKG